MKNYNGTRTHDFQTDGSIGLTPLALKANASIGLEVMGSSPIRIKFFTQVKFSNSNRIFQAYFQKGNLPIKFNIPNCDISLSCFRLIHH